MDVQNAQRLRVQLSEAELVFLLASMGFSGLAGFIVPAEYNSTAVEAARNVLVERQFVVFDDSELVIDAQISALVAAGAIASRALLLRNFVGEGISDEHWFYLNPVFNVYHNSPQPGIHQFQEIETGLDLVDVLVKALDIGLDEDVTPDLAGIELTLDLLDEVWSEVARERTETAVDMLVQHEVSAELAGSLVATKRHSIIALLQLHADTVAAAGIVVAHSDGGFWFMEPDEGRLRITPARGYDVLDRIENMMRAAIV